MTNCPVSAQSHRSQLRAQARAGLEKMYADIDEWFESLDLREPTEQEAFRIEQIKVHDMIAQQPASNRAFYAGKFKVD